MQKKTPTIGFSDGRGEDSLSASDQITCPRPDITHNVKAIVEFYDAKGNSRPVTLETRPYTPSLLAWAVPLPVSHRPIKGSPPRHRADWVEHQCHRGVLPRGFWTLADGTEILFDARYVPMWRRAPNAVVSEANPREFFEWTLCSFLHDFNDPEKNKETLKLLLAILDAWGVVL